MRSLSRLVILIALSALLLDACSIYRVAVQQGNVITQKELAKVHPGMDKLEVRTALGSPMLQDPWHPDQWTYVYSYKPAYGRTEVRQIQLQFKDDRLQSISGDVKAEDPHPPQG
ncbi:outer membrane protein assembly factor BamE [Acidithiobacillus caldus]|uniref:outer membrane protein assembly factor BamE n=1 Tax=Acidithiobacillus caldus TaxID=33059 RepID=UPI001C072981|nr:outer membrane protein assembly factor BamE [Acidithiobacillus caldus]MBU2782457.1 outer membrane protein assembly factor BamE [Acidithiobacillus caldus]